LSGAAFDPILVFMDAERGDTKPQIGCHLSMAKGFAETVDAAVALGCTALQLFTHSPSMWRMKPMTPQDAGAFRRRRASSSIRYVVVHTMYLLNLASPDEALHERSIAACIEEVARAAALGADAVVTHLGAHTGAGPGPGLLRIVQALDRIVASDAFQRAEPLRLLIENTAGSGTTLGSSFEELGTILRRTKEARRIGVCLDTCHAFAAGYDLRTVSDVEQTLQAAARGFDLGFLELIHFNDSKRSLGSRRDRHEHLGRGKIGAEGLAAVINHRRLRRLPFILETPKTWDDGSDADSVNLQLAFAWWESAA